MSHTPGPWKATGQWIRQEQAAPGTWPRLIAFASDDENREPKPLREESEANARIIAAAPDLLVALKALVDDCVGNFADCDYFGPNLERAAQAIAKAEGDK